MGLMEVLSSRTIITTPDFERSRAFYEDTLGLSVYREYGSAGVVTGVVFFLGGGFLELSKGPATTAGDAVKLWLQVTDLGAEEARLPVAGVAVRKPAERMPWGLDEMWIEDPHGIEIRLVSVPPEHPLRQRIN
jgi:catechol 2,3-dioxygenase-like lactoylglutathione lyase family enzyme